MHQETIVNTRPDREILKKIITSGDYSTVPYEDSRCKVVLSDVQCISNTGPCQIESESRVFSPHFDGMVLIGDNDCFIDRDFELILQQMCLGETASATITYKDSKGELVKTISCKVELKEVMEEQVVSEWGWERLHESALHHKEQGVELVKRKRIPDAFLRFSKALKMLIAIEPIDPQVIDEAKVKEMIDLKVRLYNNLAHCQLQFEEFEAALDLCNELLAYDPDNVKGLYRRCTAYAGLQMFEEAWKDIQAALKLDPNDKAAQQKAGDLQPALEKINKEYTNVIKKMFG